MKIKFKLFLIAILLTSGNNIIAQTDTTAIYRITLNDDSELLGKIKSESDSLIFFITNAGLELSLDKKMIKQQKVIKGEWRGDTYLRADPNRTRLLFAPTGRTLSAGEGYFSAYEIFFPFLAIGITDFITLAGGVTLFPGAEQQIIYIAPKVRAVHLDNFDLSGGVLYAHVEDENFGILYGVATYGTSRASLTLGLGWGFVNGETADNPALMIGGEIQVSNSVKILTENWKFPDTEDLLISFAIRFFGEHLAADFGLFTTTGKVERGFRFIPWIGFAYNF
jgi:hypothetical protein